MKNLYLPLYLVRYFLHVFVCAIYRLTDQIEMALFVLRYVSNLIIFALGLKAPGITGSIDSEYSNLPDGPTTRPRYYQGVSR